MAQLDPESAFAAHHHVFRSAMVRIVRRVGGVGLRGASDSPMHLSPIMPTPTLLIGWLIASMECRCTVWMGRFDAVVLL